MGVSFCGDDQYLNKNIYTYIYIVYGRRVIQEYITLL